MLRRWTINLKSFEIINSYGGDMFAGVMNYKLEKFWNPKCPTSFLEVLSMNYKLEKFWNTQKAAIIQILARWTINLKSFEIL